MRRTWGYVALSLWGLAVLIPVSSLMAGHLVTLPRPTLESVLRLAHPTAHRQALHVLAADCECSRRVREHLLARGARSEIDEKIILVSDVVDTGERERARGFAFESLAGAELVTKYHLESAPLLVVFGPSGALEYSGGYTSRKQGETIAESDIIDRLQRGEVVPALPTFGCAVSTALRDQLDPLGLKN